MKFLAFLPLLASLAAAQVSNDDPRGKEIYIISPACDSYKCQVSWKQGSTQTITWLNAPKGGLKIQLVPENGQSGSSYTITDHVGSIAHQAQCKGQSGGEKCGTFSWKVPANVKPGHYTVAASSIAQPNKVGYTDTVIIKKGKSNRAVDA